MAAKTEGASHGAESVFGTTGSGMNRRRFITRSTVVGLATVLPNWALAGCGGDSGGAASEGGTTTFKATHGGGLGNFGMFVMKEANTGEPNVELDFVVTPSIADITTLFASGQVEASTIPYTNFLTAWNNQAPIVIVGGAGVEGLHVIAGPGIESAEDLKGKTVGTFQADTLEILGYDYLKEAGLSFRDVDIKYFQGNADLTQAFVGGSLDAATSVVPFSTAALEQREGSTLLSDGVDLYGKGYTNDVIAVGREVLESNRAGVKQLLKALMLAQKKIETEREAMVELTAAKYFKLPKAQVLQASLEQGFAIDQRGNAGFILQGAQALKELNYIKKLPDESIFQFDVLEEVIDENPDLYASLKLKVVDGNS